MNHTAPKNKKDVAVLAAAIIVSILALGGAIWYFFQNNAHQTTSETTPLKLLPDSVSKGNSVPAQRNYDILKQPSPFASQTPANVPILNEPIPASATAMPQMPAMPPITPPIMPPDISAMPDSPPAGLNNIQVIGVVIGAAKTAVLSNGQIQITVKEGSKCQWGMVTSISKNGVVLDGQHIAMSRN